MREKNVESILRNDKQKTGSKVGKYFAVYSTEYTEAKTAVKESPKVGQIHYIKSGQTKKKY